MSALFLFRHAQAGPRHRYDTLSELGQQQAGLLGRYLASQGIRFQAVYSGTLQRQRQTVLAVEEAFQEAGLSFPEILYDPRWDEFDLSHVYESLAEPLREDDPEFRREYDQMLPLLHDETHDVHRNHSYCDIAVIRAWVNETYPYQGESWTAFRSRIVKPLETLVDHNSGEKIAVFTSATPISIWVGQALGLNDQHVWRLAGVTYNSGITTLRVGSGDLRLFTFNGVPHLPDDTLHSFR